MPDMYTLFKDCRVSPEIITKYIAYLHKVSFKHIKTFSDYRTRVSIQRISVHDTDARRMRKKKKPRDRADLRHAHITHRTTFGNNSHEKVFFYITFRHEGGPFRRFSVEAAEKRAYHGAESRGRKNAVMMVCNQ